MVRPIPIFLHGRSGSFSAIPLAIGLFVSVSFLVGFCARHARRMTRKQAPAKTGNGTPSSTAKQLIATISQKAMSPLIHHGKRTAPPAPEVGGEDGVWQKAIMMGERCQPPEFSGVIYYDYDGNRIQEMPKSPRHGSMTPLKNFSFPMQKNETSAY